MTIRNYYHCVLALPIVVLLLDLHSRWLSGQQLNEESPGLIAILQSTAIPYSLILPILMYWIQKQKEDKTVIRVVLLAPFLLLPPQILYFCYLHIHSGGNWDNYSSPMGIIAYTVPTVLVLGYTYIGIAYIGQVLFQWLGLVSPTNSDEDA